MTLLDLADARAQLAAVTAERETARRQVADLVQALEEADDIREKLERERDENMAAVDTLTRLHSEQAAETARLREELTASIEQYSRAVLRHDRDRPVLEACAAAELFKGVGEDACIQRGEWRIAEAELARRAATEDK